MKLGKISYLNADAIDRLITQQFVEHPERRLPTRRVRALVEPAVVPKQIAPSSPKGLTVVCPGCCIHRTPNEMKGKRVCDCCRGRGKR